MSDHPLDPELQALREKRLAELQGKAETTSTAPSRPFPITDATFDQTLQEHAVVAVDIWAPWCGPCRMIAPVLDELAQELQGKVAIAKLNSDENRAVPQKYRISGIPTLLLFRNGQLVDRIVGVIPKPQLRERFLAAAR